MPYLRHQRQEDRRQHDDQHRPFHERPGEQDEQHDQHHDQVRVVGEAEHPVRDHFRNALEHDAVAEDRRQREQEHDCADVHQAPFERFLDRSAGQRAVREHSDDDRVHDGERADLGRRENAEAQTEQQDDREQQRPDAAPRRERDLAHRRSRSRSGA